MWPRLDIAAIYAREFSGCTKVQVGSVIARGDRILAAGANRSLPKYLCKNRGCLRIEKFGDDSKTHRNPEDCRAIHSEIDALASAASAGISVAGASIWITRYPCEACARAIAMAGIKEVHYGRQQKISEETQAIFDSCKVVVYHHAEYTENDVER